MKWFRRIILGSIGLYLIALGLDIFISRSFLKSNLFEGELNTWDEIYNGNETYDLVIYGSSRSYVHINPIILDENLNINSYNFGFNGQNISLQKVRHDEFLKKKHLPNNVIINLDIISLLDSDIYNPEQFIPLLFYNYNFYELVKNDLKLNLLDVYIPLIRYRLFKYKNVDMFTELYRIYFYSNYSSYSRNKGYKGQNYKYTDSKLINEKIEISENRKEELIAIINDFNKSGINIILINSPEYISQINSQNNRNEIIDLYKSIANKYDIPFIDYSNDSINHKKELFIIRIT